MTSQNTPALLKHTLALSIVLVGALATSAEELGLKVAPGFRVSVYADHELANDIYAMTLDAHGRVVVTSRGYIKVLHDSQGLGKADKATLLATTATGGMGMCFDGDDLYFCGDGWFSRYRNPEKRPAQPPDRLIPLAFGEHGGHAMRKGPDGYWYIIGGNDSEINRRHVTSGRSPVREPDVGAILRLTPDCRQCEVIAHGFRNPYDFDFNHLGDLFTYDSDVEREYFLPWYTPTRVFHVGYAGHHGWRLKGYLRGWSRPTYSPDTVDTLWPVGRGSPTGVVCYRHHQFPEHYQNGLFVLDWTFGKVYFFRLEPAGSTYRTQPEVFLESIGTNGFDPTDVVVAPDGSLLVCMGGRGTRGAVFRVEYVGTGRSDARMPKTDIERVLDAPQPLDAWSRAQWMPLARKLGAAPFVEVITNETESDLRRIRAVEIMTELFGGLPPAVAQKAAVSPKPFLRSRMAWSLGRRPCEGFGPILVRLVEDADSHVRRRALDAIGDHLERIDTDLLPLRPALGDGDKRVRQAAARIAASLPDAQWKRMWSEAGDAPLQARLTLALAACWRGPQAITKSDIVKLVLSVLDSAPDKNLQLQAVRLIMLAWGDCPFQKPPTEVYTGYSLAGSPERDDSLVTDVRRVARRLFPTSDEVLDRETSRLLAMLEDDDPDLPARVASFCTPVSSPANDIHYLIVLARLRGVFPVELTRRILDTVLSLHQKLEGKEQRVKQVWNDRLAEIISIYLRREPTLAQELIRHPKLIDSGHVDLALALPTDIRRQAARLFLRRVRQDSDFPWTGTLVELLGELPVEETASVLRAQWSNLALRDAVVVCLAREPAAADREKLLAGLESSQDQVVLACLKGLDKLHPEPSVANLVALLRLLRRLEGQPTARELRKRTSALVGQQVGCQFLITETQTDLPALDRAYAPLFRWVEQKWPAVVAQLNKSGSNEVVDCQRVLKLVDWANGDSVRGERIFKERACQTCHAGARALGPDLAGITTRMSKEDLFTAIVDPSRDVAPAYRTTAIESRDGLIHTGIIIFESADGLIVQTGAATTIRLSTDDIISRFPSNRSLMPDGLLKDLKPQDWADLFRYLQTIKPIK
jgi:putative heme-binding domain-containing protein